jgi:hypothetical protein
MFRRQVLANGLPRRRWSAKAALGAACGVLLLAVAADALQTSAPSAGVRVSSTEGLINEGQRADPAHFTAAELKALQRRFGVHGAQPRLAQLFTRGVDELTPMRGIALDRLETLRPAVLQESRRTGINPMLLTAILFDEMQHAKPGEDLPLAAHSGLFSTHGPAQLGLSEMVKQGLLPANASPEQIQQARDQLLDPERNVALLAGQMARLLRLLKQDASYTSAVSLDPQHAKTVATLAYLHNGKLDYPARILRYMQDPELHGLLYGQRRTALSPLI